MDEKCKNCGAEIEEIYELNWPGKRKAMGIADTPTYKVFIPCREESVGFDTTKNIFIEGDNLDALKLLQETYLNKIKMIYIDPPYNTGNNFLYKDNLSHSDWLMMMYPRLKLARNLLREDGVIFISIDDNEVTNLKKICDEIFGYENFVSQFIWRRRVSSAMADNNVSTDHDYVICYQKGKLEGFVGIAKDYKNYANPDNDPRGMWISDNLTIGMTATMRPNQAYDLTDPKTGKVFPHNPNRVWAYIPSSMEKMIKEGRILFPEDIKKRPMLKRFKNELKSAHNPLSSLLLDKVGLNTEATRTMLELMGANIFEYSKPISLLKTLISQVTVDNDIILDFFAGSATTAHAAIALNAEDGVKRQYIMVQIPELCDEKSEAFKAGFRKISEIGKERIRCVGRKIKKENAGKDGIDQLDIGFRVLKIG